jgi:hypothetical protein
MAGPIVAGAIAAAPYVIPALSALFGSKAKPKTAEEMLKILEAHYGAALAPAIQGMIRSGSITGANVGQDFRTTAGRAGGLRTGKGGVGAGLANSAAVNRATDARFKGDLAVTQMAGQALPGALAADQAGLPFQSSRFQDLLGSFGNLTATTGFDPVKSLVHAGVRLFGSGPGPQVQRANQSSAQSNQSASFGSLK